MASRAHYYCHSCSREVQPLQDFQCPNCDDGFVEEVEHGESDGLPNVGDSDDRSTLTNGSAMPSATSHSATIFHFPPGSQFTHHAEVTTSMANAGHIIDSVIQTVFAGLTGSAGGHRPDAFFNLPMMPISGNVGDYAWGPGGLDAIITQLLDAMEDGPSAPPAPQTVIDQLPVISVSEKDLESQSSSCPVCFDEFQLNEEARRLPCTHLFHPQCVIPWLQRHNTCPICRQPCEPS